MGAISLFVMNTEYSLTPFTFVLDSVISNSYAQNAFSVCNGINGTRLNLADALRAQYNDCRMANKSFTSPFYRMLDGIYTDFTHTTVEGHIDMQYSYNPDFPNNLFILLTCTGFTGVVSFQYPIYFDTEINGIPDINYLCVTQTKLINFAEPMDEGIVLGLSIPCGQKIIDGVAYGGGWTKKRYTHIGPWDPSEIQYEYFPLDGFFLAQNSGTDPALWTGYNLRYNYFNVGFFLESIDGNININGYNYEISLDDNEDDTSDTPNVPRNRDTSDPVDFDELPTNSALDTGMIHAFKMTTANLVSLSSFLLSDNFISNVKKLFANPIDYILSLHMLPVVPHTSTTTSVVIGGVNSGVSGAVIDNAYMSFDMGSIDVNEMYTGFLDYSPTTRCLLFLPFLGFRDIDTNDIMDGTITLNYKVNVLTGEFLAELKSTTSHKLNGIIGVWSGSMSETIPLIQQDYNARVNAIVSSAASVGIAASAGSVAGGVAALSGAVSAALTKPNVQRSGSVSGSPSIMGGYTPYLIKIRPNKAIPANFTDLQGQASKIGGAFSSFKGYTEFVNVKLDNIDLTDAEKTRLMMKLKEGVYA